MSLEDCQYALNLVILNERSNDAVLKTYLKTVNQTAKNVKLTCGANWSEF